jgi:hypothetical protein
LQLLVGYQGAHQQVLLLGRVQLRCSYKATSLKRFY